MSQGFFCEYVPVHMGETAEDAVKREVFEETGVAYDINRLAVIHERLFMPRACWN